MPGVLKVQTAPGVWEPVVPPAPAAATPQDVLHVGVDAPVDPVVEMWWDTDEPAPTETFTQALADPLYVNVAGDTMTGALVINRTLPSDNVLRVGVPSDYWSAADTFFVANLGALHSSGGYRVSLSGNGYRNTAGKWTDLAANGIHGATQIDLDPAGYILFAVSATAPTGSGPVEVGRFVSAGLIIGKTAYNTYGTVKGFESWMSSGQTFVSTNSGTNSLYITHLTGGDANGTDFARFYVGATVVGSIDQASATTVAYVTTSHGPYKANVTDIDDDTAIARLEALRPVTFQWKLDADGHPHEDGTPTGDIQTGFIAQELATVEPGAVVPGYGTQADHDTWRETMVAYTAAAQARDADPTVELPPPPDEDPFMPWMTDNSKLVPALTAAVRALIHRNADLTARVAALEGV
jgi:hypothetical protein